MFRNLLQSRIFAWFALGVIICVIIFTFQLRTAWWAFFDEFFAFMMIFCQLVALYIMPKNVFAGKKLQLFAAFFGIFMIIALIGEFIALQFVGY